MPRMSDAFLYPLLMAIATGVIAYVVESEIPVILGVSAITFAIFSKWLDLYTIGKLNKKIEEEKKLVHRDYALNNIKILRDLLNKKSKKAIVISCSNLETILNKMAKCCEEGCRECIAHNTWKGIIGNEKTQIETTYDNDDLKEKYKNLVTTLQSIKTLIEEL